VVDQILFYFWYGWWIQLLNGYEVFCTNR